MFLRIKADFDRERQFSSDVSHELNTPLTVISGQANLLLRWGKDNPEQLEKSLVAIKNESKSMHAIIDNLLQISRLESGRITPQLSVISLGELFKRVAQEFYSVAPEVKIECEGDDVELSTDSEMLHQIITILVSNSRIILFIFRKKITAPVFLKKIYHIFLNAFTVQMKHIQEVPVALGLGSLLPEPFVSHLVQK